METFLFILLMMVGTFFLGLGDVIQKKYLQDGINEQLLLGFSHILTGLFLLPLLFLFGIPELKSGFWLALAVTAALNIVSQNVFIRAFKVSDVSLIAPLRLLSPPLVILTGFLVLGEVPTATGAIGILVTIFGLWMLLSPGKLSWEDVIKNLRKDRGLILGIIGAILFAVSFPFDKKAVVTSSALLFSVLAPPLIGVFTILGNLTRREFRNAVSGRLNFWFKPLILVGLVGSLGILLTSHALNYSLVAYASSFKRLWSFWAIVLAGQFLREKEIKNRFLATLIMFLGIVITVIFG